MGDQPSDTHFPAFFIVRNPDDSNLSACCKFGKVVFDTHRAQFGIGQFENAQVSVPLPSTLLLLRPPLKLPNATIPYRTGTRCAADSRLVRKSAGNAVPGQALAAGRPCDVRPAFQGLRIRRALRPVRDRNLAAVAGPGTRSLRRAGA